MTEKTVLLDATQEVVSAHLDLIASGTVAVASAADFKKYPPAVVGELIDDHGRWWGFADCFHRTAQIGQGITDRNQLATLTLHALFSHVPLRQPLSSGYCQVEQNLPVLQKDSAGSETENQ